MASDNHRTAERGRRLVSEELAKRGIVATEIRRGNLSLLEIRHPADGRRIHLRVKSRTSGSWQGSIRDGDPDPKPANPETYWIFAEFERGRTPGFFVVPDAWMRKDIYKAHQRYLQDHGGNRPVTADSTHHAIKPKRIERWREQWDLLGL